MSLYATEDEKKQAAAKAALKHLPKGGILGVGTGSTVNFLIELLELEKPTHIAVIFDPEGPTFRHEMYTPYKAQRPPMPEDLRKSIPYIKKIIAGLGISCLDAPGYEADDFIGTLAKRAEKEGYTVYMITPDKDYAQLVSEKVFMYKPGRSGNKSEVWGIPEVLDPLSRLASPHIFAKKYSFVLE